MEQGKKEGYIVLDRYERLLVAEAFRASGLDKTAADLENAKEGEEIGVMGQTLVIDSLRKLAKSGSRPDVEQMLDDYDSLIKY